MLAAPAAHAAPTFSHRARPERPQDEANILPTIEPDALVPEDADLDDHDEVNSLWEKLKNWIVGMHEEGSSANVTEDQDGERESRQDEPDELGRSKLGSSNDVPLKSLDADELAARAARTGVERTRSLSVSSSWA